VTFSGIVAQVSGRVNGRQQDVYDFFREVDVTLILTGRGPLPAVVSVDDPSCPWDASGQARSLELADGNSLRERLTALEAPHSFSYDIDRITGPLGKLVLGMSGRWSFEPWEGAGAEGPTRAHWHYVFAPSSWLTWLPSWLIIRLLWQPYMGAVLARTTDLAERQLRSGEG
jgi:hypothetical protein